MYIPAPFRESDRDVLYAFMASHPLAVVVSPTIDGGQYATHLPLRLDRVRGVLEGHVARANPHHPRVASGSRSLVVFTGAEAYVTPSWYASKAEHGKVVPTWNYIAVHVEGTLTWHDDPSFLRAHLEALTDTHEASQAHPWAMHDAPESYLAQQMQAIVGVSITVDALEGKYKLSQNRAAADIDGVIAGLAATDDARAHDVARQVAAHKPAR
jgi:transcriptional regulator